MGVKVGVGVEKWESGLEGGGSDVGMRCINQKVSVDEMLPLIIRLGGKGQAVGK